MKLTKENLDRIMRNLIIKSFALLSSIFSLDLLAFTIVICWVMADYFNGIHEEVFENRKSNQKGKGVKA